jgi:hypothetical protein
VQLGRTNENRELITPRLIAAADATKTVKEHKATIHKEYVVMEDKKRIV